MEVSAASSVRQDLIGNAGHTGYRTGPTGPDWDGELRCGSAVAGHGVALQCSTKLGAKRRDTYGCGVYLKNVGKFVQTNQ